MKELDLTIDDLKWKEDKPKNLKDNNIKFKERGNKPSLRSFSEHRSRTNGNAWQDDKYRIN